MKLMDKLFAKNPRSTRGKLHYRNAAGEIVTITKDIRYCITDGSSHIHMYSMEDVEEYCKKLQYKSL